MRWRLDNQFYGKSEAIVRSTKAIVAAGQTVAIFSPTVAGAEVLRQCFTEDERTSITFYANNEVYAP